MAELKPIEFSDHPRLKMAQRGATEEHVEEAIRIGERVPARQGRTLYRLNRQFEREWDGQYYGVQQVAAIVAEEEYRLVVVTILTYYF